MLLTALRLGSLRVITESLICRELQSQVYLIGRCSINWVHCDWVHEQIRRCHMYTGCVVRATPECMSAQGNMRCIRNCACVCVVRSSSISPPSTTTRGNVGQLATDLVTLVLEFAVCPLGLDLCQRLSRWFGSRVHSIRPMFREARFTCKLVLKYSPPHPPSSTYVNEPMGKGHLHNPD